MTRFLLNSPLRRASLRTRRQPDTENLTSAPVSLVQRESTSTSSASSEAATKTSSHGRSEKMPAGIRRMHKQFRPHGGTFLPICINAWTMSTRSLLDRSISSSWNHAQSVAVLQPSYVYISWFAHPPGRPQPSLEDALHSAMSNQACLLADRCALPALSGAAKRHAKLNNT